MELAGQVIKGLAFLIGGLTIIVGSVILLIKHGRSLEKVDSAKEKDKEYEKLQKIHSAHSSMSATERLKWLQEHIQD